MLKLNRKIVGKCAKFNAFTLAEMMVVMLIMSIVLAAMAPVMTTKSKVDNSSPWRYSPNNPSDAYFGQGSAMRALLGQVNGADTDNGKLVINTLGSGLSHVLFKSNDDILGDLYLNGTSLILGNRRNPAASIGNENINIGHDNWPASGSITGSSNITIGDASMTSLTSGSHNIGIGTTLTSVTTGDHNIGIGDDSLTSVTGNGNIAIGGNANASAANEYKTIAIGSNSVAKGFGTIAIGSNITNAEGGFTSNAARANTGQAIAIGNGAISGVVDNGDSVLKINGLSIAIGADAKANSEVGGNAGVAIGADAEAQMAASVAIGSGAIAKGFAVAVGSSANAPSRGIAIGEDSDAQTEYSIAIGSRTEVETYAGIALGKEAKVKSYQGIAIGVGAKAPNRTRTAITSPANIAIGSNAMGKANSAIYSIAIGEDALANSNGGERNTAIGYEALTSITGGSGNTAVGNKALLNNATGNYNTAIGDYACLNVTGSNKTCIGANSGPASGSDWAKDDSKIMFLGDKDTTVYIPGNLVVGKHVMLNTDFATSGEYYQTLVHYRNKNHLSVMMSNSSDLAETSQAIDQSTDRDLLYQFNKSFFGELVISDRRLKYVGKENTSGLDKIRQLKVFNYTYKKDTTKTPHVGVIAQDLQKVFPNAVKKGTDGFLAIRMEDMFYAVINAIKELDAKYQAQEKRINDLEAKYQAQEKRLEILEAKTK